MSPVLICSVRSRRRIEPFLMPYVQLMFMKIRDFAYLGFFVDLPY